MFYAGISYKGCTEHVEVQETMTDNNWAESILSKYVPYVDFIQYDSSILIHDHNPKFGLATAQPRAFVELNQK